jgi:hypothetical protein
MLIVLPNAAILLDFTTLPLYKCNNALARHEPHRLVRDSHPDKKQGDFIETALSFLL